MEHADLQALVSTLSARSPSILEMVIFCRRIVRLWSAHDLDMQDDIITPFVVIEDETGHLFHDIPEAECRPIPVSKPPTKLVGEELRQEEREILDVYEALFLESIISLKKFLGMPSH
jgi:hypothetical protein